MSKAHPQLPEPYNNLAVLYARQQKFDKAINALKQAIQTHPSYATAHENLGDLYARMASMAYGKARILDQKNESAETKLALIQRFFSNENSDIEAMDSGVPKVTKESDPPGESAAINEVVDRLNNWATAWSAQDMDSYASAYADEFNPPGGQSRASWSMQRRDRLNRPDFIKVVLSGFEVEMVATDRAEVRLTQRYKSDRYSDTTRKKMILVQQSDGWKILEEYSLR